MEKEKLLKLVMSFLADLESIKKEFKSNLREEEKQKIAINFQSSVFSIFRLLVHQLSN